MASGGDDAEEIVHDERILLEEIHAHGNDSDASKTVSPVSEGSISTPSDDDLDELEKRVKEKVALKNELERKARARRLKKQIEEIGQQMEKRKTKNSKRKDRKDKMITSEKLRSMKDVQEKVEKLMDKNNLKQMFKNQGRKCNKNRKKYVTSSSSSSETEENSSCKQQQ